MTGQQRFREAVPQAHERQLGKGDQRVRGVDETAARQLEDTAEGRRVVEAAARFEGLGDEDV